MSDIIYSFIIPHKNCPALLERCVDSIPNRDDVQIIVVDDNSDKAMKPVLLERDNLEIVWLNEEQSKGAGRARNIGLSKAKGEWLLFPDSDDYYVQDFLNVLDEYKGSDADIVYFNFDHLDGQTGEKLNPLSFKEYFDNYDGSKLSEEHIRYHHNVPWTKLLKNDFVKKTGLCFEEVPNGNDIFFSLTAGSFAKNILVDKRVLYYYLRNDNSIVNSKVLSVRSRICRLDHALKLRRVYKYIGHPEWRRSFLRKVLSNSKAGGFSFVKAFVNELPHLILTANDWVDIIKRGKI